MSENEIKLNADFDKLVSTSMMISIAKIIKLYKMGSQGTQVIDLKNIIKMMESLDSRDKRGLFNKDLNINDLLNSEKDEFYFPRIIILLGEKHIDSIKDKKELFSINRVERTLTPYSNKVELIKYLCFMFVEKHIDRNKIQKRHEHIKKEKKGNIHVL